MGIQLRKVTLELHFLQRMEEGEEVVNQSEAEGFLDDVREILQEHFNDEDSTTTVLRCRGEVTGIVRVNSNDLIEADSDEIPDHWLEE